MKYCTLLKEFHENYREFISLADSIRDKLVQKESHNSCNMGGSCGLYNARFKVHPNDCVVVNLCNNNFSLDYYSFFDTSFTSRNTFYNDDVAVEIEFGNPEITDSLKLVGRNFIREMHYPIQEEQYFQYLSAAELSPEEVYQYFMELDVSHACDLQLHTQHNGFEEFAELLKDKNTMKNLFTQIELVSVAYRKTNGI